MKGTVFIRVGYCGCGCGSIGIKKLMPGMPVVLVGVPADVLLRDSKNDWLSTELYDAVREGLERMGLI